MSSAGVSTVEDKLRAAFSPSHLEVSDVSGGCGSSFRVVLVSEAFEGVPLLDRQRQVHSALEAEIKAIHALELKTWTPSQFEKKRAAGSV